MSNRPLIYDEEQGRTYDILSGWRDDLVSNAYLEQDLTGSTLSVVAGVAAVASAPASLIINLGAGRMYQLAAVDSTSYGALSADARLVMQQGQAAAQAFVLSTAGLSAGQSRWALIQAQVSQVDSIPSDDPTGGLLEYWKSANPHPPFGGPNKNGETPPTTPHEISNPHVQLGT